MISKGEELYNIILADCGKNPTPFMVIKKLKGMSDVEFDGYLSIVLTNRARDPNVGKFTLPEFNRHELFCVFELIFINDSCGIHNSYWSRIIWMVKGGPLVKAFPVNAKLEEFERGERKVQAHVQI